MPDSKRRNFWYKVARFLQETGDPKTTLETLLAAALKKVSKALDRAENPDGMDFRFLNYFGSHITTESASQLLGCEFLGFEKGAEQGTIKIDPNARVVDMNALTADGGQEFLRGSVYFGIADNHVIVTQSAGLKTKDLEKYLNWLLVQKAKVLAENNRVSLCDHVPKKRTIGRVKAIEIGAPIQLSPMPQAAKKDTHEEKEKHRKIPLQLGGKAWEAVQALFGDGFALPDELKVDDLTKVPSVELKVTLRWKGSRKEDDVDFLNGIARNMSHVDDDFDYTVITDTGRIGREEFKLQQPHSVSWSKGRPDLDDIFPKMAHWLAKLLQEGKVSP